jgi:hypothetical protein
MRVTRDGQHHFSFLSLRIKRMESGPMSLQLSACQHQLYCQFVPSVTPRKPNQSPQTLVYLNRELIKRNAVARQRAGLPALQ